MKWTRKFPTKSGWYWQRVLPSNGTKKIVYVYVHSGFVEVNENPVMEEWEWAGPFPEPEGATFPQTKNPESIRLNELARRVVFYRKGGSKNFMMANQAAVYSVEDRVLHELIEVKDGYKVTRLLGPSGNGRVKS